MRSSVLKNVHNKEVWFGSPAKIKKRNNISVNDVSKKNITSKTDQ